VRQGKAAVLRNLLESLKGPQSRICAHQQEFTKLESDLGAEFARQQKVVDSVTELWAKRAAADAEYLAQLEALASGTALPSDDCQQREWVEDVRRSAQHSSALAERLPRFCRCYHESAAEVKRLLVRAAENVKEGTRLEQESQSSLRAHEDALMCSVPDLHAADDGPNCGCLWLTAHKYLTVCQQLECDLVTSLSLVRRASTRLRRLNEWVEAAFCRADAQAMLPDLAKSSDSLEGDGCQEDNAGKANGVHPDDTVVDLSSLVVHEQAADLLQDSGSFSGWNQAKIVVSIDLWLHLWVQEGKALNHSPMRSIALAKECMRPVAVQVHEDVKTLQLCFRQAPVQNPGFAARLRGLIWSDAPSTRELRLRCSDEEASRELLGALELVDKLYPLPE